MRCFARRFAKGLEKLSELADGDSGPVVADLENTKAALAAAFQMNALIVAAGVTHHYFGNDDWAEHAPGLKTVEDATAIRARPR